MDFYLQTTIFFCIICYSSSQFHAQYRSGGPPGLSAAAGPARPGPPSSPIRLSYPDPPQREAFEESPEPLKPKTPRPLILTHRQAQTHDGGFKYAFSTDNGLQQGETINPDGTRSGAYSYVDPHGQQITVKYTAGKEGFRILEGPHKTPDSAPHREQQQTPQQPYRPLQQQPQPSLDGYSGRPQTFSSGHQDGGNKYTQAFHRGPTFPIVTTAQPLSAPIPRYLTYKAAPAAEETSPSNNAIQKQPEYNDEPGKAYSFGSGYSFEFSG